MCGEREVECVDGVRQRTRSFFLSREVIYSRVCLFVYLVQLGSCGCIRLSCVSLFVNVKGGGPCCLARDAVEGVHVILREVR